MIKNHKLSHTPRLNSQSIQLFLMIRMRKSNIDHSKKPIIVKMINIKKQELIE